MVAPNAYVHRFMWNIAREQVLKTKETALKVEQIIGCQNVTMIKWMNKRQVYMITICYGNDLL